MSFTIEQARELRDSVLREKKKQRKIRVDQIVARSLPLEKIEEALRELIVNNPEQNVIGLTLLNTVTNDWNDPDRDKIRDEVYEELKKKYEDAFFGCEISELNVGNNSIAFHLTMKL